TFSENMNASTITKSTFRVDQGGNNVNGIVTYSDTTATFTPSSSFTYLTQYTVTITTGVKDIEGNAIANNYTWIFTTGSTPPTVLSVSPANNASNIIVNTAITAIFSKNMDASTITTNTFIISQNGNNINGTIIYSGTTATFIPSNPLAYSMQYIATITTGVKDSAGNAMENNYIWSFTTGSVNAWAQVSANGKHTIALKTDGSLYAWGNNEYGQLGDGTIDNKKKPTLIGTGYSAIAAGSGHTIALKPDDTLYAWGRNEYGQLGDGTYTDKYSPTFIGAGYSVIAAGGSHTLAI
ncbi:MAG: Ig-like domain-containing protein, partial [Candidatus Firestonebacteria bacterium]|nr:Ig-like domain-containing protein [Candidatus Firestonebacteria bacterium]